MNRDSKILILSTPAQISDRVTALIQGADDFLVKPYTAEDLFARIQHLENLLRISRSDNRGIELVIGEVRLAQLIARIIACLYGTSTQKRVTMRPPRVLLPTILVDARWMEHLLLNLLNHALTQSPPDAEITLDFQADGDTSEIVVGSSLQRQPGAAASGPVDSLALAKFCADCQGHGLQARIMHDNRLQLRVSNIRIN
jgi:signal transduction histidine kinase